MEWLETENRLRTWVKTLLNAPGEEDIAFLKNTSEGLSVVAHGFPWQSGDNVIISDEEFPSNRIVWESLGRYGVSVKQVSLAAAETAEDALLAAIDTNTRMVAISAVQYASGLRMDLERLGKACHEHGIALCVDAIQALGAIEQDVQRMHIDFLVADAHKWLLGPEGIAVFYCSSGWRERLQLHQYGWHMIEDHFNFDTKTWEPARSARRFECGSNNMLGIKALSASVSLLRQIGMAQVEQRVVDNAQAVIAAISDYDSLELITDPSPDRIAGIVTFRHKAEPAERLHERLKNYGIVCAMRGGGIRFSAHCYNSREKITKAVAIAAKP
jgi:cysteine desulfurase/selenocysteine lyase